MAECLLIFEINSFSVKQRILAEERNARRPNIFYDYLGLNFRNS